MGVIESEEAARRLARVIVSDIEIYNREKFQAGADLTAAIEEGRALFRSRVAPEFLPVFSSVLEDRRGASRKRPEAKPAAAASAQPAPRPAKPAEPTPRPVAMAAPTPVPVAEPPEPASILPPPEVTESAPAETPAAPAPIAAAPTPAPIAAAPTPAPEPAPAAIAPAPAKPAPTGVTRAGMIDTEEAAARLARVIISDIQLYNAKKIASGADLTTEIQEGRHLFKTRVSAELLPVFESTLASKGVGQRKRAASPVPLPPKAKPVVAAEPPPMAAAAPTPRPIAPTPAPVPAVAARPSISAAKAPPAAQPRPGVTVTRRPTPAPLSVPMAMAEVGSGRHHAPGMHTHPPGRAALPIETLPEDELPTPGAMAGMAIGITPPPSELAHPTAARAISSRPPPTPPPTPHQPRVTGPQMRIPTPVPPSAPARRERPPSLPEMAIAIDSGPHHLDPAHAALPPQEVLDALPAAAPLPPLPLSGGFAHLAHPPAPAHPPEHHAPPVVLPVALPLAPPVLVAPPRLPTPPSLPQAPFGLAIAPPPSDEEVISLRRGISKTRLLLTIAALGGAGGAIWYFLLR